jgi:hypothetical protein
MRILNISNFDALHFATLCDTAVGTCITVHKHGSRTVAQQSTSNVQGLWALEI